MAGPLARHAARVVEADSTRALTREFTRIDGDPESVATVAGKSRIYPVRLEGVSLRAAPLLRQEMLAVGGDSAHARGIVDHSVASTSVIVLGTMAQYRRVLPELKRLDYGLPGIAEALEGALRAYTRYAPRIVRGIHRSFALGGSTRVMGVLNVTPDSFSDGGRYLAPEAAVDRAEAMINEGAAVLDVGAESTRPGAREVSEDAEWARLAPVLRRLAELSPVPISVDTRHPLVAARALEAGADLINDVGGLREESMRRLAARTGAPVIVMHMRGDPDSMQRDTRYADLRTEVYQGLAAAVDRARSEGIREEAILVDPGLGFGKTAEQSLELLAHLGEFRSLGFPIVLGASRKSFLGAALGEAPVADRLEAGLAAATIAAFEGAQLVRTHDVAPTVKALRLADAVLRRGRAPPAVAATPDEAGDA